MKHPVIVSSNYIAAIIFLGLACVVSDHDWKLLFFAAAVAYDISADAFTLARRIATPNGDTK